MNVKLYYLTRQKIYHMLTPTRQTPRHHQIDTVRNNFVHCYMAQQPDVAVYKQ